MITTPPEPFEWIGRQKATDLPHYHPYWHLRVDFHQINRMSSVIEQIETLRVQKRIIGEIDWNDLTEESVARLNKRTAMEEMIGRMERSLDSIRLILRKYKIGSAAKTVD